MDLNELPLFFEVIKAGSFAEAARRLGMPASRISRRVRQLEDTLNTLLLSRSTRKLALTNAGAQLVERCAAPLELVLATTREIARSAAVPGGMLRISAPANLLDFFPMSWLKEFQQRYPGVQLDLMLSDVTVDLIEEKIDVALRDVPATEAHRHRRLFAPVSTLVASSSYLAARGMPTTPDDLANHDCLTLRRQAGPEKWRLSGPGGLAEVAVRGPLSANNAGAALEAAIAGMGIALLPVVLTANRIQSGLLQQVLPGYQRDDRGLGGGLYAVLPAEHNIPLAASAFVEFAADRLRPLDRFSPV